MTSQPAASIIILTYNNLEYTRLCLESIYAKTEAPDFELILVDNASTDGTPAYLKAFAAEKDNVKLILNQENAGFARGNNQGVAEAEGQYLVFLNNDTVVTKGWLSGLIRHLQDPTVGMVGAVTNSSGNETRIAVTYQDLDQLDAFAAQYTSSHQESGFDIRMLPFFCVALRRSVFEEAGPLDERFGIGMFEDDDYAVRLSKLGYRLLCAEDVYVHHFGSAAFSKMDFSKYWALFQKNLDLFEAKWGIKWQPHLPRAEFLPEQISQLFSSALWMSAEIIQRQNTIDDQILTINQQRDHTAELENQLRREQQVSHQQTEQISHLTAQIQKHTQSINVLKAELQNIYTSNGWKFLQRILRVRRALIPEKSRREIIFRRALDVLRKPTPGKLRGLLRETASLARSHPKASAPSPAPSPEIPSTGIPVDVRDGFWLSNRFHWPQVSVILPVFNHADLLEGAARSVLDNGYPHLELVILDDGSTDEIEPVLQRLLTNPRVRVIRQPNQKLPRALTHAHRFVHGDFITWTSADNLFAPGALQVLVKALLTHPEAVLVYADVAVIDDTGKPLLDRSYRPQNLDPTHPEVVRLYRSDHPLGFEQDNYINACFLYRKIAAEALEGHYADDLRGLEDYDFWLRMQKIGSLVHINNAQPLYYYRVHQRTMSHELLTQEREAHLQRGKRFIEYEAQRRAYTGTRWSVVADPALPHGLRQELDKLFCDLPVHIQMPGALSNSGIIKALKFVPAHLACEDRIFVRVHEDHWQIVWRSEDDQQEKDLWVWRGISVQPLVLKSRDYQPNPGFFPHSRGRAVIGCHANLSRLPVDVAAARLVIQNNPWAYFVFIGLPGEEESLLAKEIVDGLENCIILESRPYEETYALYAGMQAFWLPPIADTFPKTEYLNLLALAYAAQRPLLTPRGLPLHPSPYQMTYLPGEALDFVLKFERRSMDIYLLDRYLEAWSPKARLSKLLHLANAISQEWNVPRPDFEIEPPQYSAPLAWHPAAHTAGQAIKCALAVNTLDRGGLEEVVANLARNLPSRNIQPVVICVKSGGATAEALQKEGIPVYMADSNRETLRHIFEKVRPQVINSHWADLSLLQIAYELGIPVIETIHNTYLWLDQTGWQAEQQRSQYFHRAIAVSQLAKDFYTKWNNVFASEWISVIPNGIDVNRLQLTDKAAAREQLNLPKDAVIFLSLASYDGRKNQLGLLTAFEQVARQHPQARLICAGSITNPEYFAAVKSHYERLSSREKVILDDFRQDTGLLLSAADAFVVNSFFEGWSMAATEALLAGLPLIHSECGSARELVGDHGERGYIVPNPAGYSLNLKWEAVATLFVEKEHQNTAALIDAMDQVIRTLSHWQLQRVSIHRYSQSNFSLENTLDGYEQVMRSIFEAKQAC